MIKLVKVYQNFRVNAISIIKYNVPRENSHTIIYRVVSTRA